MTTPTPSETSPMLLRLLRALGEEWGPTGVAQAAAGLAGRLLVDVVSAGPVSAATWAGVEPRTTETPAEWETRLTGDVTDTWREEAWRALVEPVPADDDGEVIGDRDDGWPGAGPDEWRDECEERPVEERRTLHIAAKPGDLLAFVVGEDGSLYQIPVPSRRRRWFRRG